MDAEELWDEMHGDGQADLVAANTDIMSLLDEIERLRVQKDGMEAELKTLTNRVKGLEQQAINQLQLLGMRGCKTDRRTWSLSEYISITVPKENRDRVLEVAAGIVDEDGNSMADEIRTVLTQTLRSYLLERHRTNEKKDQTAPIAQGTEFDGLVTEYRTFRLGMARRG